MMLRCEGLGEWELGLYVNFAYKRDIKMFFLFMLLFDVCTELYPVIR